MADPYAMLARAKLGQHANHDHTRPPIDIPAGSGLGYVAAEHAMHHAHYAPGHVHPPLNGDELGLIVDALNVAASFYRSEGDGGKTEQLTALATRLQVEHVALREDRRRL